MYVVGGDQSVENINCAGGIKLDEIVAKAGQIWNIGRAPRQEGAIRAHMWCYGPACMNKSAATQF